MKKVIVDTNVLIDYVNGYTKWLEDVIRYERSEIELVLPTIVIAEYFTSTALEKEDEAEVADRMFSFFRKQDLNEEIAKVLGAILRRKTYAQGASLADLIIASSTIYLKGELATRNKADFAKIPNLRFFNSSAIHLTQKIN